MNPDEMISVEMPKVMLANILNIIWTKATCEVGMPIINVLKPQLEGNGAIKGDNFTVKN